MYGSKPQRRFQSLDLKDLVFDVKAFESVKVAAAVESVLRHEANLRKEIRDSVAKLRGSSHAAPDLIRPLPAEARE